jgi:hypothetical protein
MGQMSTVAAAGVVAWAVPEILSAKPAAGATLSSPVGAGAGAAVGVSTSGSFDADKADGVTTAVDTTPAAHTVSPLAFTGLNIERDAEVGVALVASGWAIQHWASRAAKPVATGPPATHQADGPAGD